MPSRHTKNTDIATAAQRGGNGEAEGEGAEGRMGAVVGVETGVEAEVAEVGVAEVEAGAEGEGLQIASFNLVGCEVPQTVPRKGKRSKRSRGELKVCTAGDVCLSTGFVHHI